MGINEKPGIFPFPPAAFVLPFFAGLVIHFAFPIRLLPLGLVQLAVGLPVVTAAVAVWLWGILTLRQEGTTFDVRKPTVTIVSRGPYRVSRNPLYLMLTVAYIGTALAVNTAWPVVLLPLAVFLITRLIYQEERYLERKFGREYLAYKARVRRWL
jgi:protein-S-isoprenylcysteine O-methyltransferase Ste14